MNSLPASPFQSGEFFQSDLSNVLHEHAEHPDKLVRAHVEFGLEQEDPIAATVEGLRKSIGLFADLKDNYDIKHAGFQPVVGEFPSGEVAAYIISDKVDGFGYTPAPGQEKTDYLESLVVKPEHKPAGIALLQRLSDYWIDKVGNQNAMLNDIFSIDQYIYDQESNEFILVDMDPLFVDEGQMKDEVESRWALEYTGTRLHSLAKSLLDSHELEVWQKGMTSVISK